AGRSRRRAGDEWRLREQGGASMKRSLLKASTALDTAATLLNPLALPPAFAANEPSSTLATQAGTAGAAQARDPAQQGSLSLQQKIALLRQKVKYVFVLFQENRSFDHYFGSYPGANGLYATFPGADPNNLYSRPATAFNSFNSVIRDTNGSYVTIQPFLIPRTI